MATKDPRVDAYIESSPDFAQPILNHLRKLIHQACPGVEETIKWSCPHFTFKGMLCGIASFKAHCRLHFWKGSMFLPKSESAMGPLGQISSLKDLPADKVLLGYIKKAADLNEQGIKGPARAKPAKREPLEIPIDLRAALKKSAKARTTFQDFSYSHKKEYVEWITEAKREETRRKRLATTIEWLSQGKPRNWKYLNC
jgi:hypothetical protein